MPKASLTGLFTSLYTPGFIYNLGITWNSSIQLTVNSGNAIDSTNSVNMSLSSPGTIATGTVGLGGMDIITLSGTVATSTANSTVTGTSTTFFTAFGTRALTGTCSVDASGTTVYSGTTQSKFLSQIAVNDSIGNSTVGYRRVTAVNTDGSNSGKTGIVVASSFSGSAITNASFNVIEQPVVQVNAQTVQQVNTITSNTVLTLAANNSATVASGGAITAGNVNSVASNTYYYIYLVVSSGTTGVILSTQRTLPLTSFTCFRRIGIYIINTSSIVCMGQSGNSNEREYEIYQNFTVQEVLSSMTTSAWTFFTASGYVPPTAVTIWFVASDATGSVSIEPANYVATHTTLSPKFGGAGNNAVGYIKCDGAQNCQYFANVSGSLYVGGFKEYL